MKLVFLTLLYFFEKDFTRTATHQLVVIFTTFKSIETAVFLNDLKHEDHPLLSYHTTDKESPVRLRNRLW